MNSDLKPGLIAVAAAGAVLLAFALTVNFPKAAGGGFKGDEATYYVLGYSLARDLDFSFDHRDLERVWQEFPTGPEGIFLKRGKAIDIRRSTSFPFVHWTKLEDPQRETRLYFSKAYIYPLAAALFIRLFGTNGFLVLHALLLTCDFLVAFLFLNAREKSPAAAATLAGIFLAASIVPVYFVWLMPELFNFSLALYALFLWSYKHAAAHRLAAGRSRFLATALSDYAAAALVGVLTFSKPTHALLLIPVIGLVAIRRQWPRAIAAMLVFVLVAGGLFAVNARITGEFNYQGGDRKTFYHSTGFPFANQWETFDNSGPVRGREDIMVGDVLVNTHSRTVFAHNLLYFFVGRYAGLLPYFFPGVLAGVLFVLLRPKRSWQWLVAFTLVCAILVHIVVWPFTYNGGGGPVGSRYFLSFYPLFLFLIPLTAGLRTAFAMLIGGAAFTAAMVLNPFFASANPGDHAASALFRLLPIDLTLLHDLPVAQHPDRMKQPLGGSPPVLAYFLDDNAYTPDPKEDGWFWVKGKSTTDIVLRAPVPDIGPDLYVSKKIAKLNVEVRNNGVPNHITISTGRQTERLDMNGGDVARVALNVREGVPFHRDPQPTSYLYTVSITTTNGFVPFLDTPCDKPDSCASDYRYLGAMIHIVPEYTDAETTKWLAR